MPGGEGWPPIYNPTQKTPWPGGGGGVVHQIIIRHKKHHDQEEEVAHQFIIPHKNTMTQAAL